MAAPTFVASLGRAPLIKIGKLSREPQPLYLSNCAPFLFETSPRASRNDEIVIRLWRSTSPPPMKLVCRAAHTGRKKGEIETRVGSSRYCTRSDDDEVGDDGRNCRASRLLDLGLMNSRGWLTRHSTLIRPNFSD